MEEAVIMAGTDSVEVERRLATADAAEVIGAALRFEGWRGGASTDRGTVGPAGDHSPGLAARVHQQRGEGAIGGHVGAGPARPPRGPTCPTGTTFTDAVEVVGVVAAAAGCRLGVVTAVSPWQLASAVTDGRLLAPNPVVVS
jgi:hypothetical protein